MRRVLFLLLPTLTFGAMVPGANTTRPTTAPTERLDTWAQLQLPFDPARVKIRLTYPHVGGTKPADLPLPSPTQMELFTELRVTIDGKAAERRRAEDTFDAVIFENREPILPGEAKELSFALADIYKIPAGWSRIEVQPKRMHRLPGVLQGVVIDRSELAK